MFGAEKVSAISADPKGETSATIELPQPNVSPLSVKKANSKDGKEASEDDQNDLSEDVSISIVSDKALLASVTPVSGEEDPIGGSAEVSFYEVRQGDTVSQVAEMFGVTPDTIWSVNEMPKGSKLKPGEVLEILPFPGVEHKISKGETLQGIANKYKVSLASISAANELDPTSPIGVGEKLFIPGGAMLSVEKQKTSSGTVVKSGSAVKVSNGYYINPVPGARRTRGVTSYHHGVDLAAPAGTPILSAASGTVVKLISGCKVGQLRCGGGFGNYVEVQHPNGTKTLYAHMSRVGTSLGKKVSQGEVIGYVGNTGGSRGDHLHIEVRGAKNPY